MDMIQVSSDEESRKPLTQLDMTVKGEVLPRELIMLIIHRTNMWRDLLKWRQVSVVTRHFADELLSHPEPIDYDWGLSTPVLLLSADGIQTIRRLRKPCASLQDAITTFSLLCPDAQWQAIVKRNDHPPWTVVHSWLQKRKTVSWLSNLSSTTFTAYADDRLLFRRTFYLNHLGEPFRERLSSISGDGDILTRELLITMHSIANMQFVAPDYNVWRMYHRRADSLAENLLCRGGDEFSSNCEETCKDDGDSSYLPYSTDWF